MERMNARLIVACTLSLALLASCDLWKTEEKGQGDLGVVGDQCQEPADCGQGLTCGGQVCIQEGAQCPLDGDCGGLNCGPDPICGLACGDCGEGQICDEGFCEEGTCDPVCGSRECGPDPHCGVSCGSCGQGQFCQDGKCQEGLGCEVDCTGLECGLDPVCGQSCGVCQQGFFCGGGRCMIHNVVSGDLTWIPIPKGRFQMGVSPNDPYITTGNEKPVHEVSIQAFELLQTEVTEAQWKAVMGELPVCSVPISLGDSFPVNCVSWDQARAFCEAVGGRLPSEAEWEYAVRATTTTVYPCGDEPSCLDEIAWYFDNADGERHPVATKAMSNFGLYDMLGNVAEWLEDWYQPDYQGAPSNQEPWLDPPRDWRGIRGGGFGAAYPDLRSSRRGGDLPALKLYNTGIRCARDLPSL